MTEDRIIRIHEAVEMIGVSKATIYRWTREGKFPPSIRLGQNSIGWRLSAVEEWVRRREWEASIERML